MMVASSEGPAQNTPSSTCTLTSLHASFSNGRHSHVSRLSSLNIHTMSSHTELKATCNPSQPSRGLSLCFVLKHLSAIAAREALLLMH